MILNIGDKVTYRGLLGEVFSHDAKGNTVVRFQYLTVKEYIAFSREGIFSTYPDILTKIDPEVKNETSGE